MTGKITPIELKMFEQGYISSRLAAYKLGKHKVSVLRQVSRGQFRAVRVGQQQFIERASIAEWYGAEAAETLGLDDWGDVFEEKDGELYARSA